jgi:hypothetical protein
MRKANWPCKVPLQRGLRVLGGQPSQPTPVSLEAVAPGGQQGQASMLARGGACQRGPRHSLRPGWEGGQHTASQSIKQSIELRICGHMFLPSGSAGGGKL